MFSEGKRLTATPVSTMIKLIVVGILLSIVGTILPFCDGDDLIFVIGILMDAVGVVLVTVGVIGLLNYRRGWVCLATAEQLYYLRLIANEQEEEQPAAAPGVKKTASASVSYSAAPTPAGMWKCTCGKEYPAYVSSCSCGVNKRDIQ